MTAETSPVLVGRDEDFTDKLLPVAPLLAVEVFSPSSVINDPEKPALTVFELDDMGVYRKVAEVDGTRAVETQQPFRFESSQRNWSSGRQGKTQARHPLPSVGPTNPTGPAASSM